MCDDHDPPTVYREKTRRARKPHKCCECGVHIGCRDLYQNVFGVWDGDAQSYSTCIACAFLRSALMARDMCPLFRGLDEEADNYCGDDLTREIEGLRTRIRTGRVAREG